MLSIRDFQFFDPEGELTVSAGHLPHWQQPGATYFITYRTIDSISAVAMERILAARDDWLLRNEIDPTNPNWHLQLAQLSPRQQQTFRRMFSLQFENELDQLWGECLLKQPEPAKIVADSLLHFDGDRYQLGAFVVMPNHVHILARILPEHSMLDQCFSWKHFQAREIHRQLGRSGHLYQSESFDHLVRDDDHFRKFRRYIESNPEKAGLSKADYVSYLPEIGDS